MFALPILLLLLTPTPARPQDAPPRVVVVVQPRPEPRDAGGETTEAGDMALFKVEGVGSVAQADLSVALRAARVNLREPFVYDPAKIEAAVRALKRFLASEGFLHATVEVHEERAVTPYVVTLAVAEGERARIAEIRFEGNKSVPSARLTGAARECLEHISGQAEEEHGLYKSATVDYCLARDVKQLLRSEGHLQAEVGEHRVEETETGVRIVAPVREGTRYRLGRVSVKGSTVFLPEQLVEMLEVKAGDIADGEKVSRWVNERLRDEYGTRGYVQYEFDIEPRFKPPAKGKQEGVADLKVDIYEGRPFTLSSITFVGNRLKTADELKRLLSLREGDIFDQRKFREGLMRLEQTGVFQGSVNSDLLNSSGVEFKADEEKGLVSIKIYIYEGRQ